MPLALLEREWAGIDLSELAIKLVNDRIAADRADKKGGEHIGGSLWGGAMALTDPPKRNDLGDLPNYRTHRHRLYGEQESVCAGGETHFPFRVMDAARAERQWPNGGPRHERRSLPRAYGLTRAATCGSAGLGWPETVKARIVAEAFEEGATVAPP